MHPSFAHILLGFTPQVFFYEHIPAQSKGKVYAENPYVKTEGYNA